jgi:hypothetical protein
MVIDFNKKYKNFCDLHVQDSTLLAETQAFVPFCNSYNSANNYQHPQ